MPVTSRVNGLGSIDKSTTILSVGNIKDKQYKASAYVICQIYQINHQSQQSIQTAIISQ